MSMPAKRTARNVSMVNAMNPDEAIRIDPAAVRPEPISQLEIQTLEKLNHQVHELSSELRKARADLMQRIALGAAIEEGDLRLDLVEWQRRNLTASLLESVLGKDELERLRARVEPKAQAKLKVTRA
jgi:hypothetical protein